MAQTGRTAGTSNGFSAAIGQTPLFIIESLSAATGCTILGSIHSPTGKVTLFCAKAEYMNPGGSVKDRAALGILEAAEKEGKLKKGDWVVEATAGNTGIGLVHLCNQRGYKCYFTAPESCSQEKIDALRIRGAQVEVCPAVPGDDERHFQRVAKRKAEELGGLWTNQFDNLSNMNAHYTTTGPEIWEQTGHKLSAFATASGTGGTIAGVSRYLKEQDPNIIVYLSDPLGSGITFDKKDGEKLITLRPKTADEKGGLSTVMEGVASGKVYGNLGQAQLDGVFRIADDVAIEMCNWVLKHDGFFVGGSSGVNLVGAYLMAKKLGPGHTIATVLCDGGDKYTSKIYNPAFLTEKKLAVGPAEDLGFLKRAEELNGL